MTAFGEAERTPDLARVGPASAAEQIPQAITWTSPASEAVLRLNQAYPLVAWAICGLPVAFRVKNGPAAIQDGTVLATNVGTIVVVAEQAGNATCTAVTEACLFNRSSFVLDLVGIWPGLPPRECSSGPSR